MVDLSAFRDKLPPELRAEFDELQQQTSKAAKPKPPPPPPKPKAAPVHGPEPPPKVHGPEPPPKPKFGPKPKPPPPPPKPADDDEPDFVLLAVEKERREIDARIERLKREGYYPYKDSLDRNPAELFGKDAHGNPVEDELLPELRRERRRMYAERWPHNVVEAPEYYQPACYDHIGYRAFEVDDYVEARWQKGSIWYRGRVVRALPDGRTFTIFYDDDTMEPNVDMDYVRLYDRDTAPEVRPRAAVRADIVAFYAEHNPAKLDTVDALLDRCGAGNEEALLEAIRQKYLGGGGEAKRTEPTTREKIEAIYRAHNPSKLAEVEGLLERCAGSEDALLAAIRRKYLPDDDDDDGDDAEGPRSRADVVLDLLTSEQDFGDVLGRAGKESDIFPTSQAPISAVFHSFRLIFGRAIIPRNGLEAWMLFTERARNAPVEATSNHAFQVLYAVAHGPAMRRTVARRMLVSDQQLLRDRIRRAADAAAQKRFRRREAQLARQVAVAGSSRGAETSGVLLCLKRCGKVSSALARVAWTCEALSAPSPREQGDDDAADGGVFRGAFVRGDRRLAVNQHVHYKPRYASLTATELLLFKTEADVRRGAPYHAVPLLGASCALARDESPSSATNRARSKLGGQSGAPTLVLTSGNSTSKKRRDVLVFASPRPGDDDARDDLEDWLIRVRLLARREQQRRAARDHDAAHHDVDAAEEEEAPPRQRSAEDHAPPPDAGAGRGRFEFASTRV